MIGDFVQALESRPRRPLGTVLFASLLALPVAVVKADANQSVTQFQGTFQRYWVEELKSHRSEKRFFLRDGKSGNTYRLKFSRGAPSKIPDGAQVKLKGELKSGEIAVSGNPVTAPQASGFAATVVTGTQNTAVLVANFNNVGTSCSVNSIQELMFSNPSGQTVDKLFQETSLGGVSLGGNVLGPYNIPFANTDSCDFLTWANAINAAAQAGGVALENYSQIIYVLPPNSCPADSIAGAGQTWVFACDQADAYAHGLGHSLGMGHAATPQDPIGDTSDFMGRGVNQLRQVNAPHREQMGWLPNYKFFVVPGTGTFSISPLEMDPAQATYFQGLKVPKADSNEYYYLSYRSASGFDANLAPGYLNSVSVHRFSTGMTGDTVLLANLTEGQFYADPVNGLTFSVLRRNADSITMKIDFGGACALGAPVVSMSPASQSGVPGDSRAYVFTLLNQDNPYCPQGVFPLSAVVPAGWNSSLSPSSLSLAPGAIGTSQLTVTPPSGAPAGSNSVQVTSTRFSETRSAAAVYNVQAACNRGQAGLTLNPQSQSGVPGQSLTYQVTLRNNDSVECAQSQFELAAAVPSGWSSQFASSTLTVAPGQVGSTTVTIVSPMGAAAGASNFTVNSSDSSSNLHGASAHGAYTVLPVCSRAAPQVTLVPTSQSGKTGATLKYTVNVKNADSPACPASKFKVTNVVPKGWKAQCSSATLSVSPGQSVSSGISVTSPRSAKAGDYSFSVTAVDTSTASHQGTAGGIYTIDTKGPSAPASVVAQRGTGKTIKVTWGSATDNVGVAGYKVWRKGSLVNTTTELTYTDSKVSLKATYTYEVQAFDAAGNVSAKKKSNTIKISAW